MAKLRTIVIAEECYQPKKILALRLTPAQYALFQLLREKELLDENEYNILDLDCADVYEFAEPAPEADPVTDEERLKDFIRKLST